MGKENTVEKHKAMVLRLAKPGADILKSMTPAMADLVHMGGCLMGEASELFDAVQDEKVNSDDLMEELGDFAFYLVKVRAIFDATWHGQASGTSSAYRNTVELMRLGGHFWDLVKRIVVYGKNPAAPDSKYDGRAMNIVAVEMMDQMEQRFNALLLHFGYSLDEILEANYVKLADADKGRYASGAYSDAEAQDRRDKRK